MLNAFVLANLGDSMQIALDAAFDIGSVFERCAEFFFLLLAMGAPIRAVHLHATIFQTAGETIVLVLSAVAKIKRQSESGDDQHGKERSAAIFGWRRYPLPSFFLPFLRSCDMEFLYHDIVKMDFCL